MSAEHFSEPGRGGEGRAGGQGREGRAGGEGRGGDGEGGEAQGKRIFTAAGKQHLHLAMAPSIILLPALGDRPLLVFKGQVRQFSVGWLPGEVGRGGGCTRVN